MDYCLQSGGQRLVLIEVKRTGSNLSSHEEQLLHYAFEERAPLAALTDGRVWWLYLPRADAHWEQRRFCSVDFTATNPEDAAATLQRFLGRDASLSGQALEEARSEFESQERDRQVRAALQDAWLDELRDPRTLLHDMLAERVRNHTGLDADKGTIAEFLAGIAGGVSAEHAVPRVDEQPTAGATARRRSRREPSRAAVAPREAPRPPTPGHPAGEDSGNLKGHRAVAFQLDGRRYEIESWRALLPQLCERLADGSGADFVERVTQPGGPSYLRSSPPDSPYWVPIGTTGLHVYVNITGTVAADRARRIMATVRGSTDGFSIESQPRTAPPQPSREEPEPKSFTGRTPTAFWLGGSRREVATWRAMLSAVCSLMASEAGPEFGENAKSIRGRKRVYFSVQAQDLVRAVSIENTDLYVEGNLSANDCVRLARRVVAAVRGSDDGFRIELAE